MILRLALRSVATRPLRTVVLAIGFGLGVAVMAELLGVGEVILEQAHAPALQGGGDLSIRSAFGAVESARFVLADVFGSDQFRRRIAAASPSRRGSLYLIANGSSQAVNVRAGIPSLERGIGDTEIESQPWTDAHGDEEWTRPPRDAIVRGMDRFHKVPDADAALRPSWAEWLYFNGRAQDGGMRFYLTFLTGGPPTADGKRQAYVRLQLDRGGATTNYAATAVVDEADLLERAPELDVGDNHVRVEDGRYHISLALRQSGAAPDAVLRGDLWLDPKPGRALPPAVIQGARGWISGYVVPVLSGTFRGTLGDLRVDGASGYHDHNWGFWEGVRWQWGQVTEVAGPKSQVGGPVSILFGRVFPPASVADPDRIPGFLGVLGPDGPIAFSTDVSIRERDAGGRVQTIEVRARGRQIDLTLQIDVGESVQTRMPLTQGPGSAMNFLQLGGLYHVSGKAAGRDIAFSARGSAETFRY